jgi:Mg-chelatase subunit ChlD
MSDKSTIPWRKKSDTTKPVISPEETSKLREKQTIPWTKIEETPPQKTKMNWSVDVMFAIDCTGSMSGEIEGVKNAVIDFANIIDSDGIAIRLGLIEYRDRVIGEEPVLHKFDGNVFTDKSAQFREQVACLKASGGGPEPESTFDAILIALNSIEDASRTNALVVITDAPPRIPDKECKGVEQLIVEISEMRLDQLYIMYPLENSNCAVYQQLLAGITGESFNLRDGKDSFYDGLISLSHSISTHTRFG